MKKLVCWTDRCDKDIRSHPSGVKALHSLRERVFKANEWIGTSFERYGTRFFKHRARPKGARIVAIEWSFHDLEAQVLVLLRYFNEHQEYERQFLSKTTEELESWAVNLIDEGKLRHEVEALLDKPAVELPELSEAEARWTYQIFPWWHEDAELGFVLEHRLWVERLQDDAFREQAGALLNKALNRFNDQEPSSPFVYEDYEIHLRYLPQCDRLVLLFPHTKNTLLSYEEKAVLAEVDAINDAPDVPDTLLKLCRRTYPLLMVTDLPLWLAVEKESAANFALSPREEEVLDSLLQSRRYPMFINGPAGSGKSTMLQIQMVNFICFALNDDLKQLPVYLTASRTLCDHACENVRKLLEVWLKKNERHRQRAEQLLQKCFRVFQEYILDLVRSGGSDSRFLPNHRTDYRMFRKVWAGEKGRSGELSRLSPDLVWHVIRSYIKGRGYDPDEPSEWFFGPEEYRELPASEQSVSPELFDHIYRWWQSREATLRTLESWDDQDLVCEALRLLDKNPSAFEEHFAAAIVCDEAQDFTNNDLKLIRALSLFSHRQIPNPQNLMGVPLIFAGDPFQTLNPSGFRWESLQSSIYQELAGFLPSGGKPEINYRELLDNFRSSEPIVKFSNVIQLQRHRLFGEPRNPEPQHAWSMPGGIPPRAVDLEEEMTALRDWIQRSNAVIVVPCNEGEEEQYVLSDEFLSSFVSIDDHVPANVWSASRAKGMEYERVVLYGFGEECHKDQQYQGLLRLLWGEGEYDRGRQMHYEYLFNKLYVGATRAKKTLVIVDTGRALSASQGFWSFAFNPLQLLKHVSDAGGRRLRVTNDDLGEALAKMPVEKLDQIAVSPADRIALAREYYRQAKESQNYYIMSQAASQYHLAGQEREARMCRAFAAKYDGQFVEAGDRFVEIGMKKDAFNAYWDAKDFQRIVKHFDVAELDGHQRLRFQGAEFFTITKSAASYSAGIALTTQLCALFDDDSEAIYDDAWQAILIPLVRLAAQGVGGSFPPELKSKLYALVRASTPTPKEGDRFSEDLARLAYQSASFKDAIQIWKSIRNTSHDEFLDANRKVAVFPETLKWSSELRDFQGLLLEWKENGSRLDLNTGTMSFVIEAMAQLDQIESALATVTVASYRDSLDHVARALSKNHDNTMLLGFLLRTIELMLADRRFGEALRLLRVCGPLPQGSKLETNRQHHHARGKHSGATRKTSITAEFAKVGIRQINPSVDERLSGVYRDNRGIILGNVVRWLARSENLPRAKSNVQAEVTSFLSEVGLFEGNLALPKSLEATIDEFCSALERAGEHRKAFDCYWQLYEEHKGSQHAAQIAQRLVRCHGRARNALRHRDGDIERLKREHAIESAEIAEFPVLAPPAENAAASQPSSSLSTIRPFTHKVEWPTILIWADPPIGVDVNIKDATYLVFPRSVKVEEQRGPGNLKIEIAEARFELSLEKVRSVGYRLTALDNSCRLDLAFDADGNPFDAKNPELDWQ